mgnify:CR=1 FL=1
MSLTLKTTHLTPKCHLLLWSTCSQSSRLDIESARGHLQRGRLKRTYQRGLKGNLQRGTSFTSPSRVFTKGKYKEELQMVIPYVVFLTELSALIVHEFNHIYQEKYTLCQVAHGN